MELLFFSIMGGLCFQNSLSVLWHGFCLLLGLSVSWLVFICIGFFLVVGGYVWCWVCLFVGW